MQIGLERSRVQVSSLTRLRATALLGSTALMPAFGAMVVAPTQAHAQASTIWDGETSADWGENTNWDSNLAPSAADIAVINNGVLTNQPFILSGDNFTVSQTNISAGVLTIEGSLTSPVALSGTGVLNLVTGGSVTGQITVGSGTAVQFNTDIGVATSFVLNGSGIANGGALVHVANTSIVDSSITLGSASTIASSAGVLVINGAVDNGGNLLTTRSATGAGTVFTGAISGSGGLTKTGSGQTDLASAQNFSGPVTVSQGTLALAGGNTLSDSVAVTVNSPGVLSTALDETIGSLAGNGRVQSSASGSTVTLTIGANNASTSFTGILANNGATGVFALTKTGTGTFTYSGSATNTGTTTISAGTFAVGSGGTTGALGTGNIVNNAQLVFNRSDAFAVANAISGSGSLTKQGTGTLTLTGANAYTGATLVSAGTLAATTAGSLGTIAGGTTVESGATLLLSGDFSIGEEALTISGTGVSSAGALRSASGNNSYNGTITLQAASRINGESILNLDDINGNGNALTLGGGGQILITGAISALDSLVKDGGGGVTLFGTNTFAAATTVSNGILNLSGGSSLSDTARLTVSSPGFARFTVSETIGSLAGNGTVIIFPGNALTTGGDDTSSEFSGIIQDTGNVIKTGTGTLTLSGNNAFGATTIGAGTLAVGNGGTIGRLGTGSVTNNARLEFNRSDAFTVSNAINGSGELALIGGTMTLSGVNGYTGQTFINSGTLIAGSNSALGTTAQGTIVSGGALAMAGGVTLGEAISFLGGQLQNIAGANRINGAIDLQAHTTINSTAGTLELGGTLQAGTRNLTFTGAGNITALAAITDVDTTTYNGTGVLSLTNTALGRPVIVNSGTLQANAGALSTAADIEANSTGIAQILANQSIRGLNGTGQVVLNGGALTVGNGNVSSTFAGVISQTGGGSLTKIGTGTFTLTGVNTYTGNTNVSDGTLINSGTLASAVTNSAAFTSTGTLSNGLTNNSTGTVSAAGTINGTAQNSGTFNVSGELVSSGGIFNGLGASTLNVTSGSFTGLLLASNTSTAANGFNIAAGRTLGATFITNGSTSSVLNAGTITAADYVQNNGILTTTGTINGGSQGFLGTIGSTTNAQGTINGLLTNRGTLNVTGALVTNTFLQNFGTANLTGSTLTTALFVNNSIGTLNATGTINGQIDNSGTFNVTGNISSNATNLNNSGAGVVNVSDGNFTGRSVVLNISTALNGINVSAGRTLGANTVANFGSASVLNAGTITADNYVQNFGTLTTTGILNAGAFGYIASAGSTTNIAGQFNGNVSNSATINLTGATTGFAAFTQTATGAFNLDGVSATVGSISGAGTIALGAGVLSSGGNNTSTTFSGIVSGSGGLVKTGNGTLTLTGENNFSGTTAITGGTVQVGMGGTTGSLGAGDIAVGGTLIFNRSDAQTIANLITGAGTVRQSGGGVLTLGTTNNAGQNFTGTLDVAVGTVLVNGNFGDVASGAAQVTVAGQGTLGGSGTINGDVSIAAGGRLAPGTSPGTMTISGDLALSNSSILDFELAQAGVVGGGINDLINVGGDLTLDGVLNVASLAGFGSGYYRLFNYGGTLTDNALDFGTVPGGFAGQVLTNIGGQVNVLFNNGAQLVQHWDGTDTTGASATVNGNGGAGTWSAAATNWSAPTGFGVNSNWTSQVGVFSGTGGSVLIDGAQAFQELRFEANGYDLSQAMSGGSLATTGGFSIISVSDGLAATINAPITGTAGLTKTGDGTLTLGGANIYAGLTMVSAGTLALSGTGSLTGDVRNDATLTNAGIIAGRLTNTGSLASTGQIQGGLTQLAGATVTVSGTINGTISNAGAITVNGNLTGDDALTNAGSGTITINSGVSVTGLTGIENAGTAANAFVVNGTLQTAGGLLNQNDAQLTVNAGGQISAATITNNTGAVISNSGLVTGAATTAGMISNASGATWNGTIDVLAGGGLTNGGTVSGLVTNGGTLASTGTLGAGLANAAGSSATLAGQVVGAVSNSGTITFSAATAGITAFTQTATGSLDLGGFATTFGSLGGSGSISLGANFGRLFIGSDNASTRYDGSITGMNGAVFKSGTGTLTLGGTATVAFVNQSGDLVLDSGGTVGTGSNASSSVQVTTGSFDNRGTVLGIVNNAANVTSTGTINGRLINAATGTASVAGGISGNIENAGSLTVTGNLVGGGSLSTTGTATVTVNSGASWTAVSGITHRSTAANGIDINGAVTLDSGGIFNANAGASVRVGQTGTLSLSGPDNSFSQIIMSTGTAFTNDGTVNGRVFSTGTIINNGTWNGTAATGGTITNNGTWTHTSPFNFAVLGLVTNNGSITGNRLNVTGANGRLVNHGTIDASLNGTRSLIDNGAQIDNRGDWTGDIAVASVTAPATLLNSGTITGAVSTGTGGTLTSTGTITQGLNNAGTATLADTLGGDVINTGTLAVTGNLMSNASLTNADAGTVTVASGFAWTGLSDVANTATSAAGLTIDGTLAASGTISNGAGAFITVGSGGTITAGGMANAEGGTITVNLGGTINDALANSGVVNNAGTYNADVANSGAAAVITNQTGAVWTGDVTGNEAGGTIVNAGLWTGNASNAAMLQNTGIWTGTISNLVGGTLTSGSVLNGNLSNASGGTVSLAGQLNGDVTNAGAITLTGMTTGIDDLTLDAGGTLDLGGFAIMLGSLAGSGSITLGTADISVGGNTADTRFDGVIAGSGMLTKTGSGTLTLGGANAYSGMTTIGSGTLALASGGTLAGAVANNATLSNAGTVAGLVTNNGTLGSTGALSGGLVNTAGKTATLAGSVSGTFSNAGTVMVTSGTTLAASPLANTGQVQNAGAWTGDVTNSAGATVQNTATGSFTGAFENRGTLLSAGTMSGSLTNSGAAQLSGTVTGPLLNSGEIMTSGNLAHTGQVTNSRLFTVGAGTFATSGMFTNSGSLFINPGATLSLGTATLRNSGAAALIDVAGTLRGRVDLVSGTLIGRAGSLLAGDVLIASGATFMSGGMVTGTATINGTLLPGNSPGTLTINGALALGGTSTTVFEMTNAISDRIVVNGTASIASGATLQITGVREATPGQAYSLVATTGGITGSFTTIVKDRSVFGFIRQDADSIDLVGTLTLPAGISGQGSATVNYLNERLLTGTVSDAGLALTPAFAALDGSAVLPVVARLNPEPYASAATMALENGLVLAKTVRAVAVAGANEDNGGLFVFGQGFAAGRDIAARPSGTAPATQAGEGFLGGIGYGTSALGLSAFVGRSSVRQEIADLGAQTRSRGTFFGAKAQLAAGALRFSASAIFDRSDADTRRAPVSGTAQGRYTLHGETYDAELALDLPISSGGLHLRPSAGVTHSRVTRGAVAETGGGAAALSVVRQSYKATWINGDIALRADTASMVQPWVGIGVRHLAEGDPIRATGTLAGFGGQFTINGTQTLRTFAHAAGGVTANLTPNLSAYLSAEVDAAPKGGARQAQGGIRYTF